jgi:hypothetical protein
MKTDTTNRRWKIEHGYERYADKWDDDDDDDRIRRYLIFKLCFK